jgi:hypothetical protein
MPGGSFASIARDTAGMNVIYLCRSLPAQPDDQHDDRAAGQLIAFPAGELEGDPPGPPGGPARTMPPPGGHRDDRDDRAIEVRDASGVIVQQLGWNAYAGD